MFDTKTEISFDNTSMDHIDLEIRLYNALKRSGITTLAEVLRIAEAGVENSHRVRNIGERSFGNLVFTLGSGGFLLYGSADHPRVASITDRLEWFAKWQHETGSWAGWLDYTLAATLSFIRAGSTSTTGPYAHVVSRAMRWLEQDRALENSTLIYALLCALSENYGMMPPALPFELVSNRDITHFDQIRQWALVYGNAPLYPWLFKEWPDREGGVWQRRHALELAWMTVGAPKPTI